MKNDKRIILLLSLFWSFSIYGQTILSPKSVVKDTILPNLTSFDPYFSNLNSFNDFNFEDLKFSDYHMDITKYNPMTGTFDTYLSQGSTFPKSSLFYESNISNLGNDLINIFTSRNLISDGISIEPYRNSLNPHGAHDFKSAVIGGFIGTLFQKN